MSGQTQAILIVEMYIIKNCPDNFYVLLKTLPSVGMECTAQGECNIAGAKWSAISVAFTKCYIFKQCFKWFIEIYTYSCIDTVL